MNTNYKPAPALLDRWHFKGRTVCSIALLSFAAGSLLTTGLMHLNQVRADSNRVFQLMIYHTLPGKEPDLESIFRDVAKLQTKHGLDVVGYWVPNDDPVWANTFIYIMAAPNREGMKKNWDALHSDPAFPQYRQQAVPLIEKGTDGFRVDAVYMRPTDYSAMK